MCGYLVCSSSFLFLRLVLRLLRPARLLLRVSALGRHIDGYWRTGYVQRGFCTRLCQSTRNVVVVFQEVQLEMTSSAEPLTAFILSNLIGSVIRARRPERKQMVLDVTRQNASYFSPLNHNGWTSNRVASQLCRRYI